MRGLLVRQIPVQLVDLSLSGCLFEATQQLRPGTTGELHVKVQGTEYLDAVSVVRSSDRKGSHLTSIGGAFTWHAGPAGVSMRKKGLQTIVPPRPRSV